MSRQPLIASDALRRARRDPRFREAVRQRVPKPDWRSRGECLRHDPELFFPNSADPPTVALDICGRCEVVGPCLAAALDASECDGVWGATTPDERRTMREAWLVTPSPRRC